jgi:hypothetical protein
MPPSKQWAALKFQGEKFAEVWIKPESDPHALTIRIPRGSFQLAAMVPLLTLANLLKAVGIEPAEVEAWRVNGGRHGLKIDLHELLTAPSQDVERLELFIRIKPHVEISPAKWQDLETRWRAILNIESAVETFRMSMESLVNEIESLSKKPLSMEEKTYAPRADVALLNKAKSRAHIALPRMKDYIHRAVWAMGSPERKRLDELYNDFIRQQIPFPQVDEVMKQLEELRKDRQVLSAHGKAIFQECKGIATELQSVMRTLHQNAVNAQKKKESANAKGRRF